VAGGILTLAAALQARAMPQVKILFFGKARSSVGVPTETIAVPAATPSSGTLASECTVADVVAALLEKHPELETVLLRCAFSLNEEYCKQDDAVNDGDTVAVIPSVSGG